MINDSEMRTKDFTDRKSKASWHWPPQFWILKIEHEAICIIKKNVSLGERLLKQIRPNVHVDRNEFRNSDVERNSRFVSDCGIAYIRGTNYIIGEIFTFPRSYIKLSHFTNQFSTLTLSHKVEIHLTDWSSFT